MKNKKRIDVGPRETSARQPLSDILSQAGLKVNPQSAIEKTHQSPPEKAPSVQKEQLHIRIERKGRQGKVVTIISGFTGLTGIIEDLARKLKSYCGVGGSVKEREIILQGDVRKKIPDFLIRVGYRVK